MPVFEMFANFIKLDLRLTMCLKSLWETSHGLIRLNFYFFTFPLFRSPSSLPRISLIPIALFICHPHLVYVLCVCVCVLVQDTAKHF